MKHDSPLWKVMGDAASPAEAAALDTFRDLLPDDGIATAWANLTFINDQGRTAEVDVLLLTTQGMYLVELKGWHGRVTGNAQRWNQGQRNSENPRLLADRKAKWLKGLLQDRAPNQAAKALIPRIHAVVVMHGEGSTVDIAAPGDIGVLTLDGYHVKSSPRLRKFSEFLAQPPHDFRQQMDLRRVQEVRKLCDAVGFTPTPKTRMVGDFVVTDDEPIAQGRDWQDVLVSLPALPGVKRRLRLYDVPATASSADRQHIEQLAQREFQLTQDLRHAGIAVPLDFKRTDDGPALVFEHDARELPLDAYMAGEGAELDLSQRIALVIRLGEILKFAHNVHLRHRALSPRRAWVTPVKDTLPQVTIRDWFFAQRDSSTRNGSRLTAIGAGVDDLMGVADQNDWIWLAPEARHSVEGLPPIPLDIYGLGALAYLVLTGRQPAETFVELEQRLVEAGALDPRAASPGMPDDVAEVITEATSAVESARPSTIEEVLDRLREASDDLRRGEKVDGPTPIDDPVDAQRDDIIADRFIVAGRRGEGSSGVALGVYDTDSDDPNRELVMKVARTEPAGRRLSLEADVLRALDDRRIVRLISGPLDVGDRRAILLSDAGKETLATRLSKEGRATVGQLEQFGSQLLEAMMYLETQGVFHRDIKPSNLGIIPDPGTRRPSLVLFDLSLASESVDNIASGTPSYLDPYLGRGRRQKYDRAAELWAVSTTLFEMATTQLPWWGEGAGRPADQSDAPIIEPTSFEPAVATQLTAFFQRALHPQATARFSSADQLAVAWQGIFADLDTQEDGAGGSDELSDGARLDTPLDRAGLSARALSPLARLDVTTVGELLGVHPTRINSIRGLGEKYRKEIQARIRGWRARLSSPQETPADQPMGTERLVGALVGQLAGAEKVVVERLLGLTGDVVAGDWPSTADTAQSLGRTRDLVNHSVDKAVGTWSKSTGRALDATLAEVSTLMARTGRVTTVPWLANALVVQRGSLLDGEERLRHGTALLRAAYEFDARSSNEPALELRRGVGKRANVIALRETADPDESAEEFPPAEVLTEAAIELGRRADELIVVGVVPYATASVALTDLVNEVGATTLAALTGRQLLTLAASVSIKAAVSRFDELYPIDLDPRQAVELALRGKPGRSISESAVRKSVTARFPRVGLPSARSELDKLVYEVLPGVVNHDGVYELVSERSSTSLTATGLTVYAPEAVSEAAKKLEGSLSRHGVVVLTTPTKRYEKATRELSSKYGVNVLDVASMLVSSARAHAAENGVPWEVVLGADAADRSRSDWANLVRLVREAVAPRWHEQLARNEPLLIINAGPLVRYGMAELLSHLLDVGTPRPAARWLLVAKQGSQAYPSLEGAKVLTGTSPWVELPSDFSSLTATPAITRSAPGAQQ
ncbi:BREX system serine/threonine kinase PglW [Rhodococcus sp. IEGM 1374]|uniref:BREX system serine/threonine kinase PglW n=1 Tax=Rhodococcus sp. IEGM 1374 TaxID=3082221 RepID=UPI0029549D8C|nr:BREX system serine/threonine kinase PglW [Rhodococcus sp. IEGM 1374]MDV7991939.1 BREX system serine/threonine kinase PglW [Rhodococcus sp. IEGM 1374]